MINPWLILVLMLAVARLTRLVTADQITAGFRRRVIARFGEESWQAYLAHCEWCSSLWIAGLVTPVVIIWPNQVVVGGLLVLATSHAVGLLAKLDRG